MHLCSFEDFVVVVLAFWNLKLLFAFNYVDLILFSSEVWIHFPFQVYVVVLNCTSMGKHKWISLSADFSGFSRIKGISKCLAVKHLIQSIGYYLSWRTGYHCCNHWLLIFPSLTHNNREFFGVRFSKICKLSVTTLHRCGNTQRPSQHFLGIQDLLLSTSAITDMRDSGISLPSLPPSLLGVAKE